jgi:hypothetical protein
MPADNISALATDIGYLSAFLARMSRCVSPPSLRVNSPSTSNLAGMKKAPAIDLATPCTGVTFAQLVP